MAGANREFIPNQVFVGLPWKNVRPKYEGIIAKIKKKYPLHFTIVGRDDGVDAQNLFEIIKRTNFFFQLCHLRRYGRQRKRLTRIRICRGHRSPEGYLPQRP
jgi:hypothetical protein